MALLQSVQAALHKTFLARTCHRRGERSVGAAGENGDRGRDEAAAHAGWPYAARHAVGMAGWLPNDRAVAPGARAALELAAPERPRQGRGRGLGRGDDGRRTGGTPRPRTLRVGALRTGASGRRICTKGLRGNKRIDCGRIAEPVSWPAEAGHPRPRCWQQGKTWVAGPRPAMTQGLAAPLVEAASHRALSTGASGRPICPKRNIMLRLLPLSMS